MVDSPLTFLQSFGALTSDGVALISSQGRSIGNIVPNVTMEETGSDTLTTTDHPVETGVAVADHSFRNPAELEMRVLWSDSTAQSVGYSIAVYNELLALQNTRMPFSVQTGKRTYANMLFRSLTQKTDASSENALTVVASFRELITVKSATTSASTSNPESTGGVADGGTGTPCATVGPNSATLFGQIGGVDGASVPVAPTDTGTQFGSIDGSTTAPATPYGDLSGISGGTFSGPVGASTVPAPQQYTPGVTFR